MAISYGNIQLSSTSSLNSESNPSNYAEIASMKTAQKREAVSMPLEGIWNLLKDFEICPKFCSKSQLKEIFTTISVMHQVSHSSLGYLSYTGFIEVLNCVAQNFMSRGSQEDKIRNMFYAMNMSTGRSKCVSNRLSGILPPLHITNTTLSQSSTSMTTPTSRGRDSIPSTSGSNLRHRRASTGSNPTLLIRTHSRSLSPKANRNHNDFASINTSISISSTSLSSSSTSPSPLTISTPTDIHHQDNLLYWLADILKDDNGVKISHDALLEVYGAFQRAYITTVSALAAIPESDMTYSELKSLGIGPIGVRTMLLNGHKKLLLSRSQTNTDKRRGSEGNISSISLSSSSQTILNTPSTTPKNLKTPTRSSAVSQLFENYSQNSSISDSPESNNSRMTPPLGTNTKASLSSTSSTAITITTTTTSPSPSTTSTSTSINQNIIHQPQVHISGNIISVAISKPLGMTLSENVPDEPLGVHIEKIIADGNAALCGALKSGYILRDLCGKEALEMEFDDIMEILREAPFDIPLEMVFIDPTKTSDGKIIEMIEENENEEKDDTNDTNDIQENENNKDNNDGEDDGNDGRELYDFDTELEEEDELNEKVIDNEQSNNRRILLRRKSSLT